MSNKVRISNRVKQMGTSAIHEMTRLSKEIDDVAFLSWAKPTSDTPEHIKQAAVQGLQLRRNRSRVVDIEAFGFDIHDIADVIECTVAHYPVGGCEHTRPGELLRLHIYDVP